MSNTPRTDEIIKDFVSGNGEAASIMLLRQDVEQLENELIDKDKLIEQMRTTLIAAKNDLLRVCDDAPDRRTKMCIDFIDSALAAEGGE